MVQKTTKTDRYLVESFTRAVQDAAIATARAPYWNNHELNALNIAQDNSRPTTLVLKQSKTISNPPTASNTARDTFSVKTLAPIEGFISKFSESDINVFG